VVGLSKVRKRFFFEKKNQKTFDYEPVIWVSLAMVFMFLAVPFLAEAMRSFELPMPEPCST
jgi:hypothetical protein